MSNEDSLNKIIAQTNSSRALETLDLTYCTPDVVINVVSSILFLFIVLFIFRPRLLISKKIAKEIDDAGNVSYVFKIVNLSLYNAFDIHVSLDERKLIQIEHNRFDEELSALPLKRNFFATLPSFKLYDIDKTSAYGLQISSKLDFDSILKPQQTSLLLQISLKHGLTGLAKSYEIQYVKNSICEGKFKDGWSMKIEK